MRFKLNRSNLAENFCMALNLNVFLEAPRQTGKTVGSACRYLYVYNFASTNTKMAFLHKNAEGSKDNLQTLKDIRDCLPPYLQMKERQLPDGKVDKGRDSVTMMTNPFNNNNIKTFPSATNKAKAASLLRGKTITMMWYDEYAFLPFNDVIYMNGAPAYKTASMLAKQNGSAYGILISTTPGSRHVGPYTTTISIYLYVVVLLTSLNCWNVLKLSYLIWRRKTETIREIA